MRELRIIVPGPARGKGRPRVNTQTRRAYTPARTVMAEQRIRMAWRLAGARRLDGPLTILVEEAVERPAAHWRRDGTLSAAGQRAPVPMGGGQRPDLDNVLKLVGDALNLHAFKDDRQLVQATVRRRWANPGEDPHTLIVLTPAVPPPGGVNAVRPIAEAA